MEQLCNNNNCNDEVSMHLYTILISFLVLNTIKIGLPYIIFKFSFVKIFFRKTELLKSFSSSSSSISFNTHSIYHQMICEDYNNTVYNYIELFLYFGYISFFCVLCPITPIIVIVIIYQRVKYHLF